MEEAEAESNAYLEYSNKRDYFIDLLMTINQKSPLLLFLVRMWRRWGAYYRAMFNNEHSF